MNKSSKKRPRRLIRFLSKGQDLRIIGVRGNPVKRTRPGRSYVLEVTKNNRLIGYVNPIKRGRPEPREFTRSMIARLKYTREQTHARKPRQGNTYKITNKKHLKKQISKKMIREIRRNKKSAFAFRVKFGKNSLLTHSTYTDGKMSEEALKNLIVSDLLYTLGRDHFRMSPKLKSQVDSPKIKRVKEATLTTQFSKIERTQRKNGKTRRKKSNEKARYRKGRKTRRNGR